MRTSTAVTCEVRKAKRGKGEKVKERGTLCQLVSDSPILRFSDSAIFLTCRAGFTLLELTLVLFIIGLLVTVLLPRFGDLGAARLETSARRLAALVRYVNGEAAFSGRVYRIRYDFADQAYAVQMLISSRDANEFVVDPSPLSQQVSLPSGVTFADIRVPTVGRVNSGQVFTHFYPHGYVDPTIIHLRDQQARVMTVLIPPITGEARVYEGYVDAQR